MDGSFPRAFALTASCFLGLSLGCSHTQTPPSVEPMTVSESGTPLKRRTPKAETCVACAESRLQMIAKGVNTSDNPAAPAQEVELTPAQIERLREEARRAYQQALSIDNHCLAAYHGLAKLYQDTDQYPKAVDTYRQGLKHIAKHESVWVELGLSRPTKKFTDPEAASLWFELGMCHARRKEWDPAIASLKKSTALDPENGTYVSACGFCLARAGRYDESYAFFAKALGDARAHYNVAQALHHAHRDDECREHLNQALVAKPDLQPARQLLAQLQSPNAQQGPIQQVSAVAEGPAPPIK